MPEELAKLNANNEASDLNILDLANDSSNPIVSSELNTAPSRPLNQVPKNANLNQTTKPIRNLAVSYAPQDAVKLNGLTDTRPISRQEPIQQDDAQKPAIGVASVNVLKNNQEAVNTSVDQGIIESRETKKINYKIVITFILFAIFSLVFVYSFLNFPAIMAKINYWYKVKTGKKNFIQKIIPDSSNKDLLFLSLVTHYAPPEKKDNPILPTKEALGVKDLSNDQIYIPRIDVRASVVWDSPVDEATMLSNLKHGVVHYKGASHPGEDALDGSGKGNVFISGHSSYYWWDDGKYKTIFANLNNVEPQDEIAIGYKDYVYIYKIFEKTIVSPQETSVVKQDTDKHIITLMTCYPVGTNAKRLIVKAELVAKGTDLPQSNNKETPTSKPVTPTSTTIQEPQKPEITEPVTTTTSLPPTPSNKKEKAIYPWDTLL